MLNECPSWTLCDPYLSTVTAKAKMKIRGKVGLNLELFQWSKSAENQLSTSPLVFSKTRLRVASQSTVAENKSQHSHISSLVDSPANLKKGLQPSTSCCE